MRSYLIVPPWQTLKISLLFSFLHSITYFNNLYLQWSDCCNTRRVDRSDPSPHLFLPLIPSVHEFAFPVRFITLFLKFLECSERMKLVTSCDDKRAVWVPLKFRMERIWQEEGLGFESFRREGFCLSFVPTQMIRFLVSDLPEEQIQFTTSQRAFPFLTE